MGTTGVRTEAIDKWVRARLGETVVVDTRRPLLFWEHDFPIPHYALEAGDVRTDLLRPTDPPPPGPWSFAGPHGAVSQWYDLVLADRTVRHVAWHRDDPVLGSRLVFSWDERLPLVWTEEDEVVAGHPRDPHHRVEVLPSSRHVEVRRDGVLLAASDDPVLLYETGLPTRYYLPESDVDLTLLSGTGSHSHCPYKGDADRYWSVTGKPGGTDLVWSYRAPKPAVHLIVDRLAFYNEHVDLRVDGVDLDRPASPFSDDQQRHAES